MLSDMQGMPFGADESISKEEFDITCDLAQSYLDGGDAQGEDFEENGDLDEEDPSEEEVMAEQGDVCADCGEPFTESNGSPALCQECFDAAEDQGVKEHPPVSKFPVRG